MSNFRLKVFHTVAMNLNFSKAAELLYISQPAVSKNIKNEFAYCNSFSSSIKIVPTSSV